MTVTLPSSLLVAAFAAEAHAEAALVRLRALGVPRGRVGRATAEGDGADVLVSVLAAPAERRAIEAACRESGAVAVLGVAAARERFGNVPHPGVDDRGGVKLPLAGEWPAVVAGAPALPRAPARVLDPATRVRTFDEIDLPFTAEEARVEADRCLRCPDPPCQKACPAGNDIPRFIDALSRGDLAASFRALRRTNAFSAICGRVCDVARQCEGACVLGKEGGQPVAIGRLERHVADAARASATPLVRRAAWHGALVAIVGAGPAGLAAAGDLADAGCRVEVSDALPVAGGAMAWGIPAFRLPAEVLARELADLERRGVRFTLRRALGSDVDLDELVLTNDAVVLALGTQGSVAAALPGRDLAGVWQAKEFLRAAKFARLGIGGEKPPAVGERCLVIGGGSTSPDVAQTVLRLRRDGEAREVTIAYRRGEEEMPARRDEVESARAEGVRFVFWAAPVAILGDGGRVRGARFARTRPGRRDARGRASPVIVPGSEFEVAADMVVFALGYAPLPPALLGIRTADAGSVVGDPRTGRTSRERVWAAGDVVTGAKTVVDAMTAGRRAARDIVQTLGPRSFA